MVVVSGLLGCLLLQTYWEMNRIMDLALVSSAASDKANAQDALSVFFISLEFLVLEVVILGVLGLIVTHRVCGPVFVIQRHLAAMLDGKYPPARPLRHGDEFQVAFNAFTAVLDSLRKRDADEVEKLNQVIAAARQKGVPEADVALLEQLVAERRVRATASANGPTA